MTQVEILGYTKRRVLKHKIRKGICQACGARNVERHRLATRDVCRRCVEQAFDRKMEV